MMRLSRVFLLLLLMFISTSVLAQQDNEWTLQRAVQYALDNNISIKQSELNQRLAKLTLQQSKWGQLPNVNVSTGYGRSFGRSVDPTTNQFVEGTSSYDYMSLSGNADVLLFGWFQVRNRITQNKLNYEAAGKDLEQLKNDVSLNVATGYLRALLAKEQVKINEQQVSLSEAQLKQTQKFTDAGRLPELNVAQLEAQLASDSANLITAITEYNAAILDMKALLNLSFETPFEVYLPEVSAEKYFSSALVTPEVVYAAARRNMASVYSSELKYKAAKKGYAASKGALLPQFVLNGQAGTNYSTLNKDFTVTGITNSPIAGSFAANSADTLQLYQSSPIFTTDTRPLGKQLDNNFRQSISLGVNIPIFRGLQQQTAVRQAKINMLIQELNVTQAEITLKQQVYKAHNDAKNALQKYYAALRSANAGKRAYDFAQKRNELGLTNTVEYLVTQNNYAAAAGNLAIAKYDLIFKLKVIDYYLGKELKL